MTIACARLLLHRRTKHDAIPSQRVPARRSAHLRSRRPAPADGATDRLPAQVDVLIVGCGPAGLTLAAQLAAFPDIKTCIVEQKPGRLLLGQADGIACRTMEMFEAFGFSRARAEGGLLGQRDDVLEAGRDAAARTSSAAAGSRTSRTGCRNSRMSSSIRRACTTSISTSCANRRPGSSRITRAACSTSTIDLRMPADQPVTVRLERLDPGHEGEIETVRARYVVGCDGARSTVRRALGRALHGDSANQAWGVMDVLAVTDFPDIRLKAADPVGQRRQHPHHSARGRLPGPPLYRARQARRERARREPQHHRRRPDRRGAADPPSLHARREGDRLVVGL